MTGVYPAKIISSVFRKDHVNINHALVYLLTVLIYFTIQTVYLVTYSTEPIDDNLMKTRITEETKKQICKQFIFLCYDL